MVDQLWRRARTFTTAFGLTASIAVALPRTGGANPLFDWSTANPLGSYPGILYSQFTATTTTTPAAPRTMNLDCLRIDVTTPGLRFRTTDRIASGWASGSAETMTKRTRDFISDSQSTPTQVVAAINADLFTLTNGKNRW